MSKKKEKTEEVKETKREKKEMSVKTKRVTVISSAIIILCIAVLAGLFAYTKGNEIGYKTKDSHKSGFEQYVCIHDWYGSTGVCQKCGLKCEHPSFRDDSRCAVCGYRHEHVFKNGICEECGTECQHPEWYKGYCNTCNTRCAHREWVDDVCTTCGLYCKHLEYDSEGYCVICGIKCDHKNWKSGECVTCGLKCDHKDHDKTTGICNTCGVKTSHKYVGGICSCGNVPNFIYQQLPESLLHECGHKGKVTTVTYQTKKYSSNNEVTAKNMDIYTPYGYNTKEKYNVLIMVHGAGGHYYDWTTNPITVGSYMTCPRNLYDNMIEQQLCDPLIIVSITSTYYTNEYGETESGSSQLEPEIRNDILPYIVQHYSTYAQSPSAKGISSAREHFGIGGLSNGSLYAYNCGILQNFDLFGNFACFSGCSSPTQYTEAINSIDNIDYPVYCYMSAAGAVDTQRYNCSNGYSQIVKNTERLNDGVNAFYCEISHAGHDWTTWSTAMYDFLLVFGNIDPNIPTEEPPAENTVTEGVADNG